MVSTRLFAVALLSVLIAAFCPESRAESNWPVWRGPHGNGHSLETGLPAEWSAQSVLWKQPLPGEGQSSPVIWGERIFLTSALEGGRKRVVLCCDRRTGKILWEQVAWSGDDVEPIHKMNSYASATCATDGEHIYAFFGRGGGLFCYTVDGKPLWRKPLGEFAGPWGTAASPMLVDNLVIQNCDADENALLIAFDRETGEEVWSAEREDFRGWSTPVLIETAGRRELVLNGHTGAKAYAPATGQELWHSPAGRGRGSPTVAFANGLLHFVEGRRGGTIYAVHPGGNGDVAATHRLWSQPRRGGRDLPSPLVIGKHVLVATMDGILHCYESPTGEVLWRQRLPGTYSASPVSYDGLAFFLNEDGQTAVLKPGETPRILHRNRLDAETGEIFRASITPLGGKLFIRSNRALYCIEGTKTTAAK